jgi:hypothetical protein
LLIGQPGLNVNPSTASAMLTPDNRRVRAPAPRAQTEPFFGERFRARMRNVVFHVRLLTYKP